MLFWFLLFLLTLAVSVVFALRSLEDYQERPANFGTPYSLFLIRRPQALTLEFFRRLNMLTSKGGLILSFEKLFRGSRRALVVFGPVNIMRDFTKELDLLELEDYSEKLDHDDKSQSLVWEVGPKNAVKDGLEIKNLLFETLQLKGSEDFWWQIVLRPSGSKGEWGKSFLKNLITGEKPEDLNQSFEIVIRAAVSAASTKDAQGLQAGVLQEVSGNGLVLIPQPYSKEQLVKFFRDRVGPQISLITLDKNKMPFMAESQGVRSLLGLQ